MQLNNILKINWNKEATRIKVTNEEFNKIYQELKSKRTEVKLSDKRSKFNKNTFALYSDKSRKNLLRLYLFDDGYKCYVTNTYDDTKNTREANVGTTAFGLLSNKFKELNNISMNKAFGATAEEFKRCVPKQFCYYNKLFFNKEILYSSIDACSQYPANICGLLPDANTAIVVQGTVEPTEEYRFAFYLNSGHCAEYQVFDTHEWIYEDERFWKSLFRMNPRTEDWLLRPDLTDEKDITVLMKASQFELTDAMTYFYNQKEQVSDHESQEYLNAKLVMNAAIGCMHLRNYSRNKYAHLVAICLGRANQKILNMTKKIGLENIAQIVVDGILYRGKSFGVSKRQFGAFYQEFTKKRGLITNYNKFIVMENDTIYKYKQGNCNKTISGNDIKEEDIKSLYDQNDWILVDPLKEIRNYGKKEK